MNGALIFNFCLSVAAEGAATEDKHWSGLYSKSLCSLSAADMEKQREAANEDPNTWDRCCLLPARWRATPSDPQDRYGPRNKQT